MTNTLKDAHERDLINIHDLTEQRRQNTHEALYRPVDVEAVVDGL